MISADDAELIGFVEEIDAASKQKIYGGHMAVCMAYSVYSRIISCGYNERCFSRMLVKLSPYIRH